MDHTNHGVPPTGTQKLNLLDKMQDAFSQYGFMPHGHCYLWKPLLVSIHVVSDFLIGMAYLSISITLYGLVKKIELPFNRVVIFFGIFIGACGLTHFMEIWNLWNADYWWSAWVKMVTAIASVVTGIYLFRLRHSIVNVAQAAKLSEQRRLDLEILTTELETRVSQKTEKLQFALHARDEFLSVASHELKTPITTMLLQAQLHKKLVKSGHPLAYDEANINSLFDQFEKLSIRIDRLVNDMIDISRIRSGQLEISKEKFDLSDLVSQVVDRMSLQFDKAGYEIPDLALGPVEGYWDILRIEQVLVNLITNAINYGKKGKIKISVKKTADKAVLIVSDSGIGIKKEMQESIFNRFERAISANEVSGLGLGLYITKQIIEGHQGKIWVESEEGKGATFFVELPLL